MNNRIVIGKKELFKVSNLEDITHRVTHIDINVSEDKFKVIIQKGLQINQINLSLKEAEFLGILNLQLLEVFCK